MAQFNQYDSLIDLSVIKEFCRENGRIVYYPKDDVFVHQGCVAKYLGVVESGYFKYTTPTSSDNEAVVGFAFEGEIVADYYNSFNTCLSISNQNRRGTKYIQFFLRGKPFRTQWYSFQ